MAGYSTEVEKSMRRAGLHNEINEIQRKINTAHVLIRELKKAKMECTKYIHEWNRAFKRAMESTMVSKIEVSGKFEGATAHKYASSLPNGIKVMMVNVKRAQEFEHALGMQIQKLQEFINRSENRITALNTQLGQI